jgi:hypothetical protein
MAAWASTGDHLSMKQTNQGAQLIPPAHRPRLMLPVMQKFQHYLPQSLDQISSMMPLHGCSDCHWQSWQDEKHNREPLSHSTTEQTAWAFNLVSKFLKYFCDVFPTVSTTSWTRIYSSRIAVHASKCLISEHCCTAVPLLHLHLVIMPDGDLPWA